MSAKLVMSIVASLIVAGIGAIVTATYSGARADGETEVRVHAIETKVESHASKLDTLVPLMERVDQRVGDMRERMDEMRDRLERIEDKQHGKGK